MRFFQMSAQVLHQVLSLRGTKMSLMLLSIYSHFGLIPDTLAALFSSVLTQHPAFYKDHVSIINQITPTAAQICGY